MNKRIFIIALLFLFLKEASAQDPLFSQSYLSPIYLNPAATGAGEYDFRLSGIYRRQWHSIPSRFMYMALSADKYVPSINGGIGLMLTHFREGYINKTGIYGSYSYSICAGTASAASNGDLPRWFLTSALQFGMVQRRIDYSKLTFADQINIGGVIPGSVSAADPPVYSGKWYPDINAGLYFNYNLTDHSRLLFGLSANHVNRPDESFTSTSDTFRSQLPVRWCGNLMYTHTNEDETWSYSIMGMMYAQKQNRSAQVGIEVTQNVYDVSLGIFYRGSTDFKDKDAVCVSLSFNLSGKNNSQSKFRLGVAHDSPIGQNKYSYTTGSTEAGFVWDQQTYTNDPSNPCKPRISSKTACPR
jgi:type IX secretion system PorP/SprF family membrane protein